MDYDHKTITFRLGSRYWWLKFVPAAGIPANEENPQSGAIGQIVWWQRTIYIDHNISARQKTATFFHELTHKALSDAPIKLSKQKKEAICDAVGEVLTQFVSGNRNFLLPFPTRER